MRALKTPHKAVHLVLHSRSTAAIHNVALHHCKGLSGWFNAHFWYLWWKIQAMAGGPDIRCSDDPVIWFQVTDFKNGLGDEGEEQLMAHLQLIFQHERSPPHSCEEHSVLAGIGLDSETHSNQAPTGPSQHHSRLEPLSMLLHKRGWNLLQSQLISIRSEKLAM
jgi:hypothetical protein